LKILAVDYGSARTGVAVSDPSATIARPLEVVERAGSEAGLARLVELIRSEEAERVVVGLPLTLRGEHGEQARETETFVEALRAAIDVPVESFAERFTTRLAQAGPGDSHQGRPSRPSRHGLFGRRRKRPTRDPSEPDDARAAAHLLSSYLEWSSADRE
jgi:putative transcription antitermination factor YqgF